MHNKDRARRVSSAVSAVTTNDSLLIVIPGLIWGASFLFIAEGLRSVAPNGVTFIRILVGFLTLTFFPAAHKPVERKAWPHILLLAILWFALPLSMFPFAEQRVSSALAGMLNGVVPLFAAIVASLLAKVLPSRAVLGGIVIGMLGAFFIALPSFHAGHSSTVAILLILAATVSYGFAVNVARPLQQQYGALPVIWRALGISALLTAPLGFFEVGDARWSLMPALSLLILGAFGTGVAFVLSTAAAGRVGAARASSAAFVMPPVALVLGVLLRGERVEILSIVGCVMCLGGVWAIRPVARSVPKGAELSSAKKSASFVACEMSTGTVTTFSILR